MGWPFIDGNCINCAAPMSSENQLFSKFTVNDEINSLKSLEQEISVLDAILYIYGFSATNLASAYLDEPREDDLSSCTAISDTSNYIIEHGLYLCTNCVSVFKQVYVAGHQLKKLSKDEALLRKAIKKFSPPLIKIEVDPDEFRCATENSKSEDVITSDNKISNSANFLDAHDSNEADESKAEDLFQDFNFEKDDDMEEYCYSDVKPDASDEKESLPSSSITLPMIAYNIISSQTRKRIINKKLSKKTRSGSENLSVSLGGPIKSDSKSSRLRKNNDISESLPKVTVKLVRIEEGKYRKTGLQQVEKMKKTKKKKVWTNRRATGLMRKQKLKLQKEESRDKYSNSELCSEDDSGNEANDQSRNLDKDKKSASRSSDASSKILKCSCGKAYSSMESFRNHEKRHKIHEPVSCDTCGASFEKYSLLYIHKNKEHSELPGIYFECKKCGRKWNTRYELKHHEKRHGTHTKGCRVSPSEEDLAKMVYCSCGKPYRYLPALQIHEKTHESLEPVTCNLCGQTFAFSYQLYGHKSLKHSEMPHLLKKCDFCDAKFLRTQNRKIHVMQHHSNSRPFICEVCGKGFTIRRDLRKHLSNIHSNEGADNQRVKCTECGLTLKHIHSLRNHMQIVHRTEKTIMCHLCGKTTKTLSNMRIHMKVHDPNRTLKTNAPKLAQGNND